METNKQLSFDEIFDSEVEYFKIYHNHFNDSQYKFLQSILCYNKKMNATKKQKIAFISIVESVRLTINRK